MLTQILSQKLYAVFDKLGFDHKYALIAISNRPDLSHYQCNAALAMAKSLKKKPREIAESILIEIQRWDIVDKANIEGPGFINLSLSDQALADFANQYFQEKKLGAHLLDQKQTVVVDYLGANVAKPMHVGHLRSTIIGDALQRIHRFIGNEVITDTHLGDWGTQMGMLICEVKEKQPNLPYFDAEYDQDYPDSPPISLADLETLYPEASAKCKANPSAMAAALQATRELQSNRSGYIALWQHFVNLTMDDLKRELVNLDVSFDLWRGESFYQAHVMSMVDELKVKGFAIESDGAMIIPLNDVPSKKELPPVLLLKSDGAMLYHSTDMATIQSRVEELKADLILYVVDLRQSLHFEQVFTASKKVGYLQNTQAVHVGFGTVNGKDGKPFKTREGGAMKLKDLIEMVKTKALDRMAEMEVAKDYPDEEKKSIADMVGMATLKFSDLVNNRQSDYVFDLERFSQFEGKTGPYVLYTAVRIKSILRKAKDKKVEPERMLVFEKAAEKELAFQLLQFPEFLALSRSQNMPHYLCEYIFNLGQAFNRFYRECHILTEKNEERKKSLLTLSAYCLKTLTVSLDLIGVKVPERM